MIITRRVLISTDGKTLTEVTERKLLDGRDINTTTVYERSSGDPKGLVGIWKPKSIRRDDPAQWKLEALTGTGGLRRIDRDGTTWPWTFDGKPNTVTGPTTISGTMIAAKLVNDNTIETTLSREGVAAIKDTWVLSSHGRRLTQTITLLGPNAGGEPTVSVYEKQ